MHDYGIQISDWRLGILTAYEGGFGGVRHIDQMWGGVSMYAMNVLFLDFGVGNWWNVQFMQALLVTTYHLNT